MIQDILPHHLDNRYRPDAVPRSGDPVFILRGRELALRRRDEALRLPEAQEFAGASMQFLFSFDGKGCFLLQEDPSKGSVLPEDLAFYEVRSLRRSPGASRELTFSAFTALQLASWYRDNVYCGTCGSLTRPGTAERSLVCPSCGRTIYPRVIPAVIVGVIHGDYLLHTRYERSRGVPFYALVAGFTEIGETLEETVAREVMEETGLAVKNIRYFKSQPWGIADDILAGFYCDVEGSTTIRLDTSELCEGVWIHRRDIQGQPDDSSLTNHMMLTFRDGLEPRGFSLPE